jgi:hypothetical protein
MNIEIYAYFGLLPPLCYLVSYINFLNKIVLKFKKQRHTLKGENKFGGAKGS